MAETTHAGIRNEQDKRNEVSAEEGPFWKREEGETFRFMGRAQWLSTTYDIYYWTGDPFGSRFFFRTGNGKNQWFTDSLDGMSPVVTDAIRLAKALGLIPLTAMEEAQQRVQELEKALSGLIEVCEADDRYTNPENSDEYAALFVAKDTLNKTNIVGSYLAALSGTEEAGGAS